MVCIVCLHSCVVLTSQKHRNRKQTVVSPAQGKEKWEVVQKYSFSFTSFCPSDGNRDNTTDLPRHDEGMKKGQSPRNKIAESRQSLLILLEWQEQGYKPELPWFIMYTKRKRGWLANSEGALCGGGGAVSSHQGGGNSSYQFFHTLLNLVNTWALPLPMGLGQWSLEEGFAQFHGSGALILVNNTHSLRTSSSPYVVTQASSPPCSTLSTNINLKMYNSPGGGGASI